MKEFIRNPPDLTTQLRNGGPLEFPTSPFLDGKKLCVTQSDTTRRDNFPNTAGEVGPPGPALAKIWCLDQAVSSPACRCPSADRGSGAVSAPSGSRSRSS